MENIAALLEIVRIYSYRDIPPTPDAVQTLVEMGFQESDVIEVRKETYLCGFIRTLCVMPRTHFDIGGTQILGWVFKWG